MEPGSRRSVSILTKGPRDHASWHDPRPEPARSQPDSRGQVSRLASEIPAAQPGSSAARHRSRSAAASANPGPRCCSCTRHTWARSASRCGPRSSRRCARRGTSSSSS